MSIKQIKPFKKFNTHPPGVKKSSGIVKAGKASKLIGPTKSKNKLVGIKLGK
jgi:hypothetical protein